MVIQLFKNIHTYFQCAFPWSFLCYNQILPWLHCTLVKYSTYSHFFCSVVFFFAFQFSCFGESLHRVIKAICIGNSMTCSDIEVNELVSKSLYSAQLVQTLSQVDVLFLVFCISEHSFSSWISWISKSGNSSAIFLLLARWDYFVILVTIVTEIFTYRYFKLSWNKIPPSQPIKLQKFLRQWYKFLSC